MSRVTMAGKDLEANRMLRLAMELRGISAKRLAVLSGIPYEQVRSILREKRAIYADELLPLAGVLGIGVDYLLGQSSYTGGKNNVWSDTGGHDRRPL